MMLFLSLLMLFSGIAWGGYLFWRDRRRANSQPKINLYQQVARNPTTQTWLQNHLTGNPIDDVRAIRTQFGLSTDDAEKLLRRNAHLLKK
ncbi:hypothetical protein [Alysiella filiformis]|uniref:Uncharacterized protein n=1 Tax=Alysiella filiformis DSM 16848 TaxID=1120981 RepID=A0A286EC44_9NEIS|nr:hypothetical protein [Alysiella filiformis]QMT30621.1 hypothetical protein H3L97_07630 [Alysiella filiformis]UBQ56401.1 hypothetical protein JF568_01055 [Alysiella filiformis DSM 16848]SOD68482.1 hypothetical protein SAMN02746062_01271 [Alysiella filiformis DSM 16848]